MATLKLSLDVVDGTSVRVSCDIVEPYVEPSILSPVKRNAVRIALTPEASSTPADVRQMFSFAGAIESFEVHEKAAIVTYESEQAANAALLLDGAATLIGSPVGVEVVLMNREEVAAAPATATPGELASPPAFYAAPDAQEDEDEHLVLFSRDGPKAATKAFYAAFVADAVNAEDGEEPEEQAFYSAAVLKSMVSAGYALGERAVQYIADVDERNGYAPQRLRKSASELGAATVEALRSSAEQVRSLDAEHQISSQISSHVRSTAAKLNEKGAEVASSAMTSAKGAATSATEVAASAASAGLTTARARVAELATLPKTRETVNSTLAKAASKGGEVVSGAVAKGSAVTAKVVGDVKSAVEEVVEMVPPHLREGAAVGVEKGRVLATLALAKGQRLLFSCPSPVKSPPAVPASFQRQPSALGAAPPKMGSLGDADEMIVSAEISADMLSPTYADELTAN